MPDQPPDRLKLARESYLEVLDATKHQDDKIGRLLTAIAFLTGGALVFVNRGTLEVRYQIGDLALPLLGWALGAFLLLVSFCVLVLILSLTTPLTRPGADPSHLFFKAIAKETDTTWVEMWSTEKEGEESLRDAIESEYVDETLNIARRADGKNARLAHAASFALAAMLFFTLAVTLAVDVLVFGPTSPQVSTTTVNPGTGMSDVVTTSVELDPMPWTAWRGRVVGGVLAVFAWVLLLQYRRLGKEPQSRRGPALWIVAVAYPVFVLVTVLGLGTDPDLDCLVWATGIVSAVALAVALGCGTASPLSKALAILVVVVVGFLLVPVASGVVGEHEAYRLLAAVLAVVVLLLPRPLQALHSQRRWVRGAKKQRKLEAPVTPPH